MFGRHFSPTCALLAALLVLGSAGQSHGQPPEGAIETAPTIQGVLRSSQLVLDRLETIFSVTSEEDRAEYDTLTEYIELFLIGVDRKKPVRLDVFTMPTKMRYLLHVPIVEGEIGEFAEFNLDPIGIPVQQFAKRPSWYKLGGGRNDAYTGYMVYVPQERDGYATIFELAVLAPSAKGPSPINAVGGLLATDFDAAMSLVNKPEGVEARHKRFAADKDKVLDELQRQAEESEAEFELRKFAASVQYDEVQRIYAEAKTLIAGGAITENPAEGQMAFKLEALPETPLAVSIELMGQTPSRFASVPVPEDAASTGRITFPLDEFRKEHFLALAQTFRETEISETDSIEGATPEQKAATKEFLAAVFDRIDAGVQAGMIDAFMDMTKNEQGVYTVVGGAVSPDAGQWVPVLEMVSGLKNPPAFEKNVGKIGEVALHEIEFPAGKNPEFENLFGDARLIIGTGKEVVWYAAGPGADAALKAAVEAASKPGEPSPTVFTFRGELLPAFKILDRRRGEKGEVDLRARAIEAFANEEGRLQMEVVREGSKLVGTTQIDVGVLRLIGASLAEISRENLAQ